MLELKNYASRPVKAVQVIDVNEQGLEVVGLFDDSNDEIKISRYDKRVGPEKTEPAVRMRVLSGRGNSRSWRQVHDGNWIVEEHDGTKRVFRDRSFRNTFCGPVADDGGEAPLPEPNENVSYMIHTTLAVGEFIDMLKAFVAIAGFVSVYDAKKKLGIEIEELDRGLGWRDLRDVKIERVVGTVETFEVIMPNPVILDGVK